MIHSVASIHARTATPSPRTHSSPQFTAGTDFRIQKKTEGMWEIAALSDRALKWLKTEHRPDSVLREETFGTDLGGANLFIRNARDQGYRIEYVGPLCVNFF
ncbi:hypothetical protein QN219_06740 [Sinorhizobium sp. 7-81]|uniref:hypothetical protein n=1 Tax=Sinorhizobium sp. 8-89 TaxID=3049089 RepID=UPI0024C39FCC|nr:hypothetical protein [Sinorhizobium sp. 8-89]MDK1489755.1 hypothetical protein [Sinorhizobium sp. 8-89]